MKIKVNRMGWAIMAVTLLVAAVDASALLAEYRDWQARSAETPSAQQDVPAMPSIPPAGRWVPEKDRVLLSSRSFLVDACPYEFRCGSSWCGLSADIGAPGWYECKRAGAYANVALTAEKMVSAAADVGPE